MTHIEEVGQDLYNDVNRVVYDLSYCEQELKVHNKYKQEKSLTPEQRFDDIKRIGKRLDKAFSDATQVLQLIRMRKTGELQERSGFFYTMYLVINDLSDRIIWQMYGDLSDPFDDQNSTFTSDNENTEKEN